MDTEFEVQVFSDPDHEDLVAEILCRGDFCAMLTQEQGFDKLRIEIHARPDGKPWDFEFQAFDEAVRRARSRLWDLRRSE